MSSLEKQLADVEREIEELEEKRREIYRKSLEAPEEEKACEDFFARMAAEGQTERTGLSFPIEISAINWVETEVSPFWRKEEPQLVKVRPVGEDKTFLGIHVGELPLSCTASYNFESKVLSLKLGYHNPAIVVPELNKIVMGCESWWGEIKNEEDLAQITDEVIRNQPYVKALRKLVGEDK